jgi:predicted Zn-dependent peptidase
MNMSSKPKRFILNNNLRVLLVPLKKSDLVTIGIFIKVGSRNENKQENGIAHFLEHMMFKGTTKRPKNKIAEEFDNHGASYNAMTSKEYTGYYVTGHKQDLNLFIDIIIDLYCHPTLLTSDIEKERSVIIEELNMGLNDPSTILMAIMHEKLFPKHPLGIPIIGTKKTILNLEREDFLEFRRNNYTPDNSIMVVCGDIDSKHTIQKIEREFRNYNPEKKGTDMLCPTIHQEIPYVYLNHNKNMAQTAVMIVFNTGVELNSENSRILDLVADILSSGSSSRLFHILRIKLGVTYFNHSYDISYTDNGLFVIHMGVDNKRVMEVIGVVLDEIYKLKKRGIKKEELKKAKKIRKTSFMLSVQNPKDFVFFYGLNELFDPIEKFMENKSVDAMHKAYTEYDKITLDAVNNVIKKYFTVDRFNLFVYGNVKDVKNDLDIVYEKSQKLK